MVIKLYGKLFMPNVQRALVVFEELKVPYNLIQDYGDNKSPFGFVPVLEDNGFRLYESRPIGRYLVSKYGRESGLLPNASDIEQCALFEQAASAEVGNFETPASTIAWHRGLAQQLGYPSNPAEAAEHEGTLGEKMKVYEKILSEHEYFAGDTLTLVDLWHLPYGASVERHAPAVLNTQPNVQKWWQSVSSRPSWKAVQARVEKGE